MSQNVQQAPKRKRGAMAVAGDEVRTSVSSNAAYPILQDTDNGEDEELQSLPSKKQKTTGTTPDFQDDTAMQDIADGKDQAIATRKPATSKKGKGPDTGDKVGVHEERIYTPEEVQAFSTALKNLTSWEDDSLEEKYVKIIQWFDRDSLRGKEVRQRWTTEGYRAETEDLISYAALNKWYNQYAGSFYAKKGLTWIPLGKRGAKTPRSPKKKQSRPEKPAMSKPASPVYTEATKEHVSTQEAYLQRLFGQVLKPAGISLKIDASQKLTHKPNLPFEAEVTQNDIDRYHANLYQKDVFSFKCESGDALRGHPSRPVLRRDCAAKYCEFFREVMNNDSDVDTVTYGNNIDGTTVQRFIACVSPSIRSSLPTHDLVEITTSDRKTMVATQIQWTMRELQDLYMFSHHLGTETVCDMIMDRWHEELHRPTARTLQNELGHIETFNILGFEPTFVSYLAQHDRKAFDFLSDIFVTKGMDGWNLLAAYGLRNWSEEVKTALIEKLESEETLPVCIKDPEAVCQTYHHHHEHQECYKPRASAVPSGTDLAIALGESNQPGAITEKPSKERTKRKREHDEDECTGGEHTQKKLKEDSEFIGHDPTDSEEDQENSDEDLHAVNICLPDEFNDLRHCFVSDLEEDDESFIPYENNVVLPKLDRVLYNGQGMNGTKDSDQVARKKLELVEKQLELFREAGYDVDDLDIDLSEGGDLDSEDE
ncbi:Nn.00g009190.m01.CDS01 [Neocucurbitaria sp. VM-36]